MLEPITAGVDPGLVHTGLVVLQFAPSTRTLAVSTAVIDGLDSVATRAALEQLVAPRSLGTVDVFIEQYRVRHNFSTDERMLLANTTFRQALDGTLVRNMGVKKLVSRELLEALDLWSFPTTHHGDLRSAARICLLGMMLEPRLNRVLFDYLTDTLEGRDWHVART